MHPFLTKILHTTLSYTPFPYLHSLLFHVGAQAALTGPPIAGDYRPLHNVCEYLNAVHIYADEARGEGKARVVEATHFCSHVHKDLRQCLIYDSSAKSARLIGVEYMIPKAVYETLEPVEQKLWHSHEYEVKSGMLVMPYPSDHQSDARRDEWDKLELEAMKEVMGLYGKTWHFWQVDRGDELPLGYPTLMGSLTHDGQVDLQETLQGRNERYGVQHTAKAEKRSHLTGPGVHDNADSWWKEAQEKKLGVYEQK